MSTPEGLPIVPQTPVEVTLPFAEKIIFNRDFDAFMHSNKETDAVFEMNVCLRGLDMMREYEVVTSKAFVLPEEIVPDEDGNVHGTELDLETGINGDLIGARTLKIGEFASGRYVRAVCLTFEDVLIRYRRTVENAVIPRFEMIEDQERMYIPVFAINQIHVVH